MNKIRIVKPDAKTEHTIELGMAKSNRFYLKSDTIEIDIDEMAEKVAKELLRTRNISIEKVPLAVDIGNMLYKYLQEVLNDKKPG